MRVRYGIAFAPGLGKKYVSSFELVELDYEVTSAPCYT